MFHGIYVKTRPKGKWFLVSITSSTEVASHDLKAILNQAKLEDNDKIQACIQTFSSGFHIPEFLSKIKDQKLYYN